MSELASLCPVVAQPLPEVRRGVQMKSAWSSEGRTAGDTGRREPGRLCGFLLGGLVLALGVDAAWWWGVGGGGQGGWPPRWTCEPLTGSEPLLRGLACLLSVSLASWQGQALSLVRASLRAHQGRAVPASASGTFQIQRSCDLSPRSVAAFVWQPR